MKVQNILKIVQRFTSDNAPFLLTATAVVGVISTSTLAAKAGYRTGQHLAEQLPVPMMSREEKIQLVKEVAPLYIPTFVNASVTIACIIASHKIGMRRAAALAAAYSITEKAFEDYREKAIEKLGPLKERQMRDEVAQDNITKQPLKESKVIFTGDGEVPVYDAYSKRYYKSSMAKIQKAENIVNYRLRGTDFVSLNDYYDAVGIPGLTFGEDVGWNSDQMLEVMYTAVLTEDEIPAIHVAFTIEPKQDKYRKRPF